MVAKRALHLPHKGLPDRKLTPNLHTETAVHECVSEEALAHLKSYKYSSVDKSYISYYILRHYVCDLLEEESRMLLINPCVQ